MRKTRRRREKRRRRRRKNKNKRSKEVGGVDGGGRIEKMIMMRL
jgi:hypothetical protein